MRTNSRTLRCTVAALMLVAMPLTAWAQPKVAITIKAEKEVTVTAKGKQVKKRIAAKGVQPGEEIIYTLNYANSGTRRGPPISRGAPATSATSPSP